MKVIKRSGETEDVSFDKVLNRLKNIQYGFGKDLVEVDIYDIAQKVCTRIYNNVSTTELDELAAHICSSLIIENPAYGEMASRVIVSNHHKNTSPSFSETIVTLFTNKAVDGSDCQLVSEELFEIVMKNKEKLNSSIDYNRDFEFDYFGFKTLERAYLIKIGNKVVERPQQMFMRVALGIHGNDIKDALQTYDLMSKKYFIHATPTLFNSGTKRPQLSSCFLLSSEDSINSIYDTLKECANISKYAGGIGMHIHTIRSKGSRIRGTNGNSTGIIPMLRVFNNTARYVNQCFTPDTEVYTSEGLKRMQDVWVDDMLVTIDGSLKKVNYVSRKHVDDEDMLSIHTNVVDGPLKCTRVHEIGIFDGNHVIFKPASEVKEGDMLYYPKRDNYKLEGVSEEQLRDSEGNGGSVAIVTKVETFTYTGEVYDFNMTDNHNYLTTHGIVHNSGKRNGSIAVYLEPWHADIEGFLDLRKPNGSDEERTRDLFLAMWISDLFMKRVKGNEMWSLMCPDACPGLSDKFGEDFERLYESYEMEGRYVKQVPAQKIWFKILESQIESGQPYMLYKDACNAKSNQKNLGTIKSSNLCTEILEMSNGDETAVCLTGDTEILTVDGIRKIKDCRNVEVYTVFEDDESGSNERSDSFVRSTLINNGLRDVYELEVEGTKSIKCTKDHKFLTVSTRVDAHGESSRDTFKWKTYEELDVEDCLYFPKTAIIPRFDIDIINVVDRFFLNLGMTSFGISDVLSPCISHTSPTLQASYLSGMFSAHGVVGQSDVSLSHELTEVLYETQSLLKCFGIVAKVCNGRLCISDNDNLLGFSKRVNFMASINKSESLSNMMSTLCKDPLSKSEYARVISKSHHGLEEVYDLFVPGKHHFIANNIVTHNCNLASIALPTFLREDRTMDFGKLHDIAKIITKNLNKVIDVNFYPVEKAKRSNLRHRPIGIGIQGLADLFVMMKYPFESAEAAQLNKDVFETIYHGALEASLEIAKKRHEYARELTGGEGARNNEISLYLKRNEYDPCPATSKFPGSYSSFEGSPASQGILQFDMWGVTPSERYDWAKLKDDINVYGTRNSLLLAPMPTASTSQILGFNECFEAFTSNIYKRKTLAGEFILVNKYLINDLINLKLWSKSLKDKIIIADGSIQGIEEIPGDLKELYKTVWEIKQKAVIDMAADRGAFICQSQSMNLFMEDPDFKKLSSMHFYAWQKGLKTGMYYLRSKPKANAQKFTIEPTMNKLANVQAGKTVVCTEEVCTICSS